MILLVPVTPATVQLADARFLGLMHDHALLVNAARGPSWTPTRCWPS